MLTEIKGEVSALLVAESVSVSLTVGESAPRHPVTSHSGVKDRATQSVRDSVLRRQLNRTRKCPYCCLQDQSPDVPTLLIQYIRRAE
jgi:hypothetical protein